MCSALPRALACWCRHADIGKLGGRDLVYGVRPEHIRAAETGIEGRVELVEGTGSEIYAKLDCKGDDIACLFRERLNVRFGDAQSTLPSIRQRCICSTGTPVASLNTAGVSSMADNQGGKHVLCVGAAVLDTLFRVHDMPKGEGKVLPYEMLQIAEGMASSAAYAVHRMGGRASRNEGSGGRR